MSRSHSDLLKELDMLEEEMHKEYAQLSRVNKRNILILIALFFVGFFISFWYPPALMLAFSTFLCCMFINLGYGLYNINKTHAKFTKRLDEL